MHWMEEKRWIGNETARDPKKMQNSRVKLKVAQYEAMAKISQY